MISRGLQIAANGMLGLIENQDAIAHNLANVNTAGYKKEALFLKMSIIPLFLSLRTVLITNTETITT